MMADPQLMAPTHHAKYTKDVGPLAHVLTSAAFSDPCKRLFVYPLGNTTKPTVVSYNRLYVEATEKSLLVRSCDSFRVRTPILLHLDTHWDLILWFWAVVLAGGIPVPLPPFSNAPESRQKQIQGLSNLFESPICITTERRLHEFGSSHTLQIFTVEFIHLDNKQSHTLSPFRAHIPAAGSQGQDDVAVLMLTSGTSGTAKAVQLKCCQILAAVDGKASVRQPPPDKPFLNWVGLDHVAGLVEIHIQALRLKVDQIHVQAADLVSSPRTFLDLLSRHQVSVSFAPNFFLAKLVSAVSRDTQDGVSNQWDLSGLVRLASGGEANEVQTCVDSSSLLCRYGAPSNVITPGFGMTETCAGAIFNLNCPESDVQCGSVFTSVGKCMNSIQMRVTLPTAGNDEVIPVPLNESGHLEVRGEVVFTSYYRNEKATTEAFTQDGWFRTGDTARIDPDGNLHLIGRAKEVMNINGVKFSITDIQVSCEQTVGAQVSRVVSFPSRSEKSKTEQVTVAYVPESWPMSVQDMIDIDDRLVKACILCTSSRPFVFSLAHESLLPKSTLGKVSRAQMTSLFEGGAFAESIRLHDQARKVYTESCFNKASPPSEIEERLMDDFVRILDIDVNAIGTDSSVFEMGFTSLDLIRLKRRIDERLQIDLPIITIMKNPTARSLATALGNFESSQYKTKSKHKSQTAAPSSSYDPVVTLHAKGSKTPLWLIHPGVGEVLVFVGLARYLASDDRPIYALRARGFESGQSPFHSIPEAVNTYRAAIRREQPEGPYAIAGYSYGTMLAFEVAKKLHEEGAVVPFLGSFNLPPHIKSRMRQLNWNRCLLHLSYFLALVSESFVEGVEDRLANMSRDVALTWVMNATDQKRMVQLGLGRDELANWAELAYGLQNMAIDYDPAGEVESVDVFHAIPLKVAAESREDWVQNHLSRWGDFSRTEPRFHHVGGAHYTMIGPEHAKEFASTLKRALKERGL